MPVRRAIRRVSCGPRAFISGWLMLLAVALMGASNRAWPDSIDPLPPEFEGVGVDEHTGEKLPLDLQFRDDRGEIVRLSHLFGKERPVIVSLNYSNCPLLCSLQLNGMMKSLKALDWSAGKEFYVVSASIDPLETPERAALAKQKYLEQYSRPGTAAGVRFLVGSQESIRRLADAIGFRFKYLSHKREYVHPAVFVICTPDGRISRYVYGVEFAEQTMRLSLVEASEGKVGGAWERFLLFCLHYDSAAGQYTPAVWKIMRTGALLTLAGLAGMVMYLLLKERRTLKTVPLATASVSAAAAATR